VGIAAYAFDAAAAGRYLELCRDLYRGDPGWIPPLERQVWAQFAPSFPFYSTPGNAHRHFLATAGGRPAGHVSAFVNHDLRDTDGTPVGAVGFLECLDDPALAAELLGAARGWLAAEHGLRRVWGPVQFDLWHGYRLMTHGFDTEIFFGEPYNRPWYPALFTHAGFTLRKRWSSVEVGDRAALEALGARSAAAHTRACAAGWRFAPIGLRDSVQARELQLAIDNAYRGSLGFAPLSPGEFAGVLAGYAQALDPRFVLGARQSDGVLAGFALAYPDLARAVRAMGGHDTPAARLRFWWHARPRRRAVFFMIGVVAAQAGRGLGRALYHACLRELLAAGHGSVVFALLAEDSPGWWLLGAAKEPPRKQYALFSAEGER
jgi:hypothetical protein